MEDSLAPPKTMPHVPFWDVVRRDLAANSHRRGTAGMVVAYIFTPGFACAFQYRLVIRLLSGGRPSRLAGRLLWLRMVRRYGCYISWLARIGPGLALPHPAGIVVGEDVEIGADATIYQHVTLGRSRKDEPSYPRVGDRVTLYAGAVIAGSSTLGDNVVVGANAVVGNRAVPAGGKVFAAKSVTIGDAAPVG